MLACYLLHRHVMPQVWQQQPWGTCFIMSRSFMFGGNSTHASAVASPAIAWALDARESRNCAVVRANLLDCSVEADLHRPLVLRVDDTWETRRRKNNRRRKKRNDGRELHDF
jgi:hypothetical protein